MMKDEDYLLRPKDKDELLRRIQADWNALENAIQQLSEEQMTTPDEGGWSFKDNLAHLAAWHRYLRFYHLRGQPPQQVMGVDEAFYEELDEDGLNHILYLRNKDRPLEEVLAELRQTYAEVLADLEGMSFDELMQPHYADDPEQRPLLDWVIGNTYDHYREHLLRSMSG